MAPPGTQLVHTILTLSSVMCTWVDEQVDHVISLSMVAQWHLKIRKIIEIIISCTTLGWVANDQLGTSIIQTYLKLYPTSKSNLKRVRYQHKQGNLNGDKPHIGRIFPHVIQDKLKLVVVHHIIRTNLCNLISNHNINANIVHISIIIKEQKKPFAKLCIIKRIVWVAMTNNNGLNGILLVQRSCQSHYSRYFTIQRSMDTSLTPNAKTRKDILAPKTHSSGKKD